ncbi:glycoside hydrolase family 18 protein [Suillus paluster]|uniref:glycoside hydrolase family 18 protein n=1 Tax=Suillus paluster TaxID=48578 RepID=UPI001B86FC03|nr:glycoside hydrolase family 18 protein [Suillus paluster]KAG1752670.1 glycoside hydrolase family 18 protein [Suillus paluster]
MGYYVDWAPRDVNFPLFDFIDFAFALPDQNYALAWDTPDAAEQLEQLVKKAHPAGSRVKLSIGGWTGSQYFSQAVSTVANRKTFVDNILAVYKKYLLDGIDIDWEYPGQPGRPGNSESPSDSENMLQFLQLLRKTLPPEAKISAAVSDTPFAGPDGQPIKDASSFAESVDWILLMNYDDFQAANPPGPNAPLYDGCGNSTQPSQNAVAGYNAWTQAGFPANKIVLGIPGYGYVSNGGVNRLRQRSPEAPRLHRLARRTTVTADGDHQVQFRDLVTHGILQRKSDGTYDAVPSSGFQRSWDDCSATPYLHSSTQTIPYDDPESLGMKAQLARKTGMLGINMFDVHGDTDQWDLMAAARSGLLGPASPSTPASSLTQSPSLATPPSVTEDQPGPIGPLA